MPHGGALCINLRDSSGISCSDSGSLPEPTLDSQRSSKRISQSLKKPSSACCYRPQDTSLTPSSVHSSTWMARILHSGSQGWRLVLP